MTQYTGGCQCGAVRYRVELDRLEPAIACNCSRCQKLGSLLAFAPRETFSLERGEDDLTEYTFNTGTIRHMFCAICGIESFAYGRMPDGTPMAAINLNCLDGVDPRALQTTLYDGRSA
ncbi:GFA family protein [Psychromarinibacter sp. C21-152]|uniref:GFA family protein n=1 Tax=Psychromarinibacter sediminicola TaxID=3033385 RepID=A0AAE3TBC5_9RHOB|nr:GFA family protein [Psychromarinibacter sediminicola]MDF0603698.1 GFA family protein [Psychromarinibacter sediminicola]